MPFYRPSFIDGQIPVDESANRELRTPFLNNTGRPLYGQVSAVMNSSGAVIIVSLSKTGFSTVRLRGSGATSGSGNISSCSFIVPVGWNYEAFESTGTGTLTDWVEYKS